MKKQVDESRILNELEGASLFFSKPDNIISGQEATDPSSIEESRVSGLQEPSAPRRHDTVVPRYHDTIIETVRKAVKVIGKEAATYRFTILEKQSLAEIVYMYRREGIHTGETEITRIGINYLIEEYREDGKNSVLARVLGRLNE